MLALSDIILTWVKFQPLRFAFISTRVAAGNFLALVGFGRRVNLSYLKFSGRV